MIAEHLLQDCQTHQNVRSKTWSADTAVRELIYSPLVNLCSPSYRSSCPSKQRRRRRKIYSVCQLTKV